jgi:WD40 repeat protein
LSDPVDRARFERVMALFDKALERPVAERSVYLERACGDDEDLRKQVASLLDEAQSDDGFLESDRPGELVREKFEDYVAAADEPSVADGMPSRIGDFRILGLLGRGGMGTVYEAEQDNPRRRIALKVLRTPFVSPDLRARFERESEILGRLRHPGIAHVYQAGVIEEDNGEPVPYFAMELIDGISLSEYATAKRLDTRGRLALMVKVCDAVEHAHGHGVIHRDLKPDNILVDERGEPRVLDFGVARIVDRELATHVKSTATGLLIGTLSYMSPEQVGARPDEIDVRSDVYALGVVTFELLSGQLPLEVTSVSIPDAVLQIRELDPPHLGALDKKYRGDVGTIVEKALDKEPHRRYASATALSADIRRYLADEPILAKPTSSLYQLGKFARRNKAIVAGVLVAFVALLVGTLVSTRQAVIARRERADAVELRQVAERQTYRARIAAGASAVESHDALLAQGHLEEVPESLRGWEWRHLYSRLDQSSVAVAAASGRHVELRFGPDARSLEVRDSSSRPAEVFRIPLSGDNRPGKRFHVGLSRPQRLPEELHWQAIRSVVFARGESVVEISDLTGAERMQVRRCDIGPGTAFVRALAADGRRGLMSLQQQDPAQVLQQMCDLRTGTGGPKFFVPYAWASALSADGSTLAVSPKLTAGTHRVELFSTADGKPLRTLAVLVDDITALDLSRDGKLVVAGSFNGVLRLWNVETGELLAERRSHDGRSIQCVRFSSSGTRIASGSSDHTVHLWSDDLSGDPVILHGHSGVVSEVRFSQGGARLASSDRDGVIRVWDLDESISEPEVLRAHEGYVNPVRYSPDGRLIASGAWDGTVRLWDSTTGEVLRTFDLRLPGSPSFGVTGLAFAGDGLRLAVGTTLGDVFVFDPASGRLLNSAHLEVRLYRLAFSPDGDTLYAGTEWEDLLLLDSRGLGVVDREPFGLPISWSADGQRVLLRDSDTSLVIRDGSTGDDLARLEPVDDETNTAVWSPDGTRIVTASANGAAHVWDSRTGGLLGSLGTHSGAVHGARVHPDGTRVVLGGADGVVRIYDLETREELLQLRGHEAYVYDLDWSHDGETLASASGDGTLRLWHTAPRKERTAMRTRWSQRRAEGSRLVADLFAELAGIEAVAERLRSDPDLEPDLRRAALNELLLHKTP